MAAGTGGAGRGACATADLQPDADDDSSRLGSAGHGNGGPAVDDGRCIERRAGQGRAPDPADSSETSESGLGDPQSTGRRAGGGSRMRWRGGYGAAAPPGHGRGRAGLRSTLTGGSQSPFPGY